MIELPDYVETEFAVAQMNYLKWRSLLYIL